MVLLILSVRYDGGQDGHCRQWSILPQAALDMDFFITVVLIRNGNLLRQARLLVHLMFVSYGILPWLFAASLLMGSDTKIHRPR